MAPGPAGAVMWVRAQECVEGRLLEVWGTLA
jgi:hypothetical protein